MKTPPGDSVQRKHGQSKYSDIISNPEYYGFNGRAAPTDPANVQVKSIHLPPIDKSNYQP